MDKNKNFYKLYGTYENKKRLIDKGLCHDVLCNDPDVKVREYMAYKGYYTDHFLNDDEESVKLHACQYLLNKYTERNVKW